MKNKGCERARPIARRYMVEMALPVVQHAPVLTVAALVDDPDEPIGEVEADPLPEILPAPIAQVPGHDAVDVPAVST